MTCRLVVVLALVAASLVAPFAIAVSAAEESGVADDREALVALYEATSGTAWSRSSGWLSDQPIGANGTALQPTTVAV